MKNLLFAFFVFTGIGLFAQETKDLKWYTIEEAEKIQLQNPDKPMFIDVYTDWCGWCKKMDNSTFKDPKVVEILNQKYIPVKLDAEQKEEITFKNQTFKYLQSGNRGVHQLAFVLLRGELSYPSYLVLNSQSQVTHILKGFLAPDALLENL